METKIDILDYLQFNAPTNEQCLALNGMAEFVKQDCADDFFILCGAAGTGKSSITSALIGYLNSRELCYHIAAPTGRAARILGRKTNCINSTIHSLIYNVDVDQETGEIRYSIKENKDNEYCVYIIDEASMISTIPNNPDMSLFKSENSLLTDLILFVKRGNIKNKIIFLGDRNQLSPINEKESLALSPDHLIENFSLTGSTHFLTEVKRQESDSYIMENAIIARKAIDDKLSYAPIKAFKFNYFSGAVTKFVDDFRSNKRDFVISINPFHKGNQIFNRLVREKLFGTDAKLIVKGDWMLVTKSWSRNAQNLYNGDHVEVEEINFELAEYAGGLYYAPIKLKSKDLSGKEIVIDDYILLDSVNFPTGCLPIDQEKAIRAERFRKNKTFRESGNNSDDKFLGAIRLTYGYSITCHKAQGGEWDKVYMSTFNMPGLKYQYTAITRAVNSLVLY